MGLTLNRTTGGGRMRLSGAGVGRIQAVNNQLATSTFPEGTFADGNNIQDWTYRLKVTIDHTKVSADLTNFLLMVDLSDLDPSFHTNVKSDGSDIRVTKSDGTTEVAYYISQIDTTGQTGIMWVRYDGTLSSTVDTDIYLYYGNASANVYAVDATYGRNSTFQDYEAFWDFEQDPSGTTPQLTDLTGNGNDGTSAGTMTSGDEVTGKVGNAWDFDGINDGANCGTGLFFNNGTTDEPFSISAWVNPTDATRFRIAGKFELVSRAWVFTINAEDDVQFSLNDSNLDQIGAFTPSLTAREGTDIYIAGTYDGSETNSGLTVYVDGVDDTVTRVGTAYDGMSGSILPVEIGKLDDFSSYSDGTISVIAIRGEELSANYISTEYANQNDPSTFYTIGTIES